MTPKELFLKENAQVIINITPNDHTDRPIQVRGKYLGTQHLQNYTPGFVAVEAEIEGSEQESHTVLVHPASIQVIIIQP
jgi:hypothetical protein